MQEIKESYKFFTSPQKKLGGERQLQKNSPDSHWGDTSAKLYNVLRKLGEGNFDTIFTSYP